MPERIGRPAHRARVVRDKRQPGPSDYNQQHVSLIADSRKPSSPAFSMAGARNGGRRDSLGPGPAKYSTAMAMGASRLASMTDSRKPAAPAISFAAKGSLATRRQRPSSAAILFGNSGPGPGAHSPFFEASTFRVPAYSMGHWEPRQLIAGGGTPGPASYATGASLAATKHRAATMSFGKVVGRSRVKGINMATPGPAAYSPTYQMGSTFHAYPRYSMGGVGRSTSAAAAKSAASPGPGAYFRCDREKDEVYTDITHTGERTMAKGSTMWARDVGRPSTAPRWDPY